MGTFQILAQPLILAFADSTTLGIGETVCASGMLVSSLFLGAKGIRQGYVKKLCRSLLAAGAGMVGFGLWVNILDELQGRAWGMIGFLSQSGYVVAYGVAGAIADGIAARLQISVGRGAAWAIIAAGVLLGLTAAVLYLPKSVRGLEKETLC